ncbi:hypothetical protein TNCT_72201 [Trichonephila clavata]|uniref:Transposase n=1 Tax=Trichonephila clavata TaxID=2740835 RepID=A0A8X6JNK6_TRICU|nr:hypothetical protein TNCT_72201 [Trichonephila clavata]
MYEDRRWMLLEFERTSGIERRTVHRILRHDLHLRKIAVQWVQLALTEFKRWLCYAIWSDHFARLQQDRDQFLSGIIAIDEFGERAKTNVSPRSGDMLGHQGCRISVRILPQSNR